MQHKKNFLWTNLVLAFFVFPNDVKIFAVVNLKFEVMIPVVFGDALVAELRHNYLRQPMFERIAHWN